MAPANLILINAADPRFPSHRGSSGWPTAMLGEFWTVTEVLAMKKHDRRSAPVISPFPAADQLNGTMLDAMTCAGENCAAWSGEVVRFVSERLRRDAELGLELMTCHNWTEAAKLQQDWLATATQDYLEEGSRLLGIASRFGGKGETARA